MKRLLPYLVFVLVTSALVAFVYKDKIFTSAAKEGGAEFGGPPGGGGGSRFRRDDQPVSISTDTVRIENVPVYLSGVGTVQAFNTANVRAQVSGRLIEVNFIEGQDVKTGDVLARLDPVLYKAAYDEAVAKKAQDEAQLSNARRDAERYASLASSNYSSQQQADTARSQVAQYEALVRQDQAQIDTARANLDYTSIRAPIDGRTGIRQVDVGNLVTSGDSTSIVVITQLKPISVVFTLPEQTVPEILAGQEKAALPLQALTGGGILGEGAVTVIDNQVDQSTGTVKIKGTFPNEASRLWPGQFVNVKLRLKTLENAIVVPSVAIQQGAKGSYVYRVTQDNTAQLVYVTVVQEGEKDAVVKDGLALGEAIVTGGFSNLKDGIKVKQDSERTASGAPNAAAGESERRKRSAPDQPASEAR